MEYKNPQTLIDEAMRDDDNQVVSDHGFTRIQLNEALGMVLADKGDWRGRIDAVVSDRFRLIVPDQRGFGR